VAPPRVGIVSVWHETNTYASRRATLADFERFELLEGDAVAAAHRDTGSVVGGFLDATDLELVPLLAAGTWPSGPADAETALELRRRLQQALSAAPRLDGMLLNLHGAMVTEAFEDADLMVVETVRESLGALPLAAVLDLHANPSPELAAACDALIAYDTYPHVDMRERGREAAALLAEALAGRRLATAIGKLPLLTCPLAQATDAEPMRSLQERARQRGREAGVARVSLTAGFPYSDVARAGTSVLVVHDADAADAARAVVRATLDDVEAHATAFEVQREGPQAAVDEALRAPAGPVVLADVGDNIGGGSPGDGTALLAELLRREARGAVVVLADAEAVAAAEAAGVGGRLQASVGGKTDALHGPPLPVDGVVEQLSDGRYRTSGTWMTGKEFSMGRTAVLAVDGVTVVLTERPTPPFHVEQLTSLGIDPNAASVIVAKGAVAWRAAYGELAASAIEVATPGVCPVDLASLPRRTDPVGYRP
jgi:microcystin degradation protein MlrC